MHCNVSVKNKNQMFEYLFSQYKTYPIHEIALEITAVIFGLFSVWYAKKDNILVFPTGIVSTSIYVYLLWKWGLLGDMIINAYYFIMSIYGWYHWTRKKGEVAEFPISTISNREKRIAIIIFIFTVALVVLVYHYFDKFTTWYAYLDTFITGIFFVGMWLMAKRKIETDLIVIASHQHTPVQLQLHGSVAEGVLRQAHCPVLCLRQPTLHPAKSPASTTLREPQCGCA